MAMFTVDEARASLARLLQRVEAGEEIVIARGSVPIARLVPVGAGSARPRLGTWAGELTIAADFDEPVPEADWAAADR